MASSEKQSFKNQNLWKFYSFNHLFFKRKVLWESAQHLGIQINPSWAYRTYRAFASFFLCSAICAFISGCKSTVVKPPSHFNTQAFTDQSFRWFQNKNQKTLWLSRDHFFEAPDSPTLHPDRLAQLEKLLSAFKRCQSIDIYAYHDGLNSPFYRTRLSLDQAKSLATHLSYALGIPPQKIQIHATSMNVAQNRSVFGRMWNRYLEIDAYF